MLKIIAIRKFTLFIHSLISLLAILAINAYGASSTSTGSSSIGVRPVSSPTPSAYNESYFLTSNPSQYLTFSNADYPPCPDTSFTIWQHCAPGYTPHIMAYVSSSGGWNGQDTGHDINGWNLKNIWLDDNGNNYTAQVCISTFYGSGQGNAGNGTIGYYVTCQSN